MVNPKITWMIIGGNPMTYRKPPFGRESSRTKYSYCRGCRRAKDKYRGIRLHPSSGVSWICMVTFIWYRKDEKLQASSIIILKWSAEMPVPDWNQGGIIPWKSVGNVSRGFNHPKVTQEWWLRARRILTIYSGFGGGWIPMISEWMATS